MVISLSQRLKKESLEKSFQQTKLTDHLKYLIKYYMYRPHVTALESGIYI